MEYVKKYWFVGLVAILFCFAIGYFAISEQQAKFSGKVVDGKDVVFEYNKQDVTADDLFDAFFDAQAPQLSLNFLQLTAFKNAKEPTKEMKDLAQQYYDNYIAYAKYYYGEKYEEVVLPALKSMGYTKLDDLKEYYLTSLIMDEIKKEYFTTNIDQYWDEFNEKKAPRTLSHILVKVVDPENLTEEEQAKIDAIDAAFAEGKDFADIAKEFSDDSSAANGGALGYSDNDTSYVSEFLTAAKELKEGERSNWVVHKSTNVNDYNGYHLILCTAASKEALIDNEDFLAAIANYYGIDALLLKNELVNHTVDYHGHTNIEEFITKHLTEVEKTQEDAE